MKEIFPLYDISHLRDSIFLNLNSILAEPQKISLEEIIVRTNKKLNDNDFTKVGLTFGTSELSIDGRILNYIYDRDNKNYQYSISLKFTDKKSFLKWLAIVRGIHKARYKC